MTLLKYLTTFTQVRAFCCTSMLFTVCDANVDEVQKYVWKWFHVCVLFCLQVTRLRSVKREVRRGRRFQAWCLEPRTLSKILSRARSTSSASRPRTCMDLEYLWKLTELYWPRILSVSFDSPSCLVHLCPVIETPNSLIGDPALILGIRNCQNLAKIALLLYTEKFLSYR